MVLFVFDDPGRKPRWLPLQKIENLAKNNLKIISSETTVLIGPKLWWNGLSVVIFQNCVRRSRPPTKMATVTKPRTFSRKSLKSYLLWNYWANWAQTMMEWSSDGPLCVRRSRRQTKIAAVTKNRKICKKSLKNYLFWNYCANWAQTMVEWSFGGHLL
jgi:hypothetical protein